MKNVKIEVPEGYEIDKDKSTFENIVFKKKDTISDMHDVYRLNGTSEDEFIKKWMGFEGYEVAMAQEKLIVAAYNKGEKPDWSNSNQSKYYPYFDMNNFSYDSCGCYFSFSSGTARLCFLRKKDLLDAVDKFINVYKRSRLG